MKIEPLAPLTLKTGNGQSRTVEVGETIDLPSDQAMKLCARASGKVWVLPGEDWLSQWHALAVSTLGITRSDPRYQPIITVLDELDRHFSSHNQDAFKTAMAKLRDRLTGTQP